MNSTKYITSENVSLPQYVISINLYAMKISLYIYSDYLLFDSSMDRLLLFIDLGFTSNQYAVNESLILHLGCSNLHLLCFVTIYAIRLIIPFLLISAFDTWWRTGCNFGWFWWETGTVTASHPTSDDVRIIHVYLRDIYLIYRWYKPEPIFISELVHFWFPYSCNRSSLWPLKMLNGVTFNE